MLPMRYPSHRFQSMIGSAIFSRTCNSQETPHPPEATQEQGQRNGLSFQSDSLDIQNQNYRGETYEF